MFTAESSEPGRASPASVALGLAFCAPALGLAFCAPSLGLALESHNWNYHSAALLWLTIAFACCVVPMAMPMMGGGERFSRRWLTAALAVGVAAEWMLLLAKTEAFPPIIALLTQALALLGWLQMFRLGVLGISTRVVMLIAYCAIAVVTINNSITPPIDVYFFQQSAAKALLDGKDPYATHASSIYPPDTPYYGPGFVDKDNRLTIGDPYPPMSLLMTLPGFVCGGDVRYSMIAAAAASAALMMLARPGRRSALAAAMFLLVPYSRFLLFSAWTEPLVVFSFSLVMFCACRWRRWLPIAVGIFLATKQYSVLTIPLLYLLTSGPRRGRELAEMLIVGVGVAAAVTAPFFLWNPREFVRSVVLFHLNQPFRPDAINYQVWYYNCFGQKAPAFAPFAAVLSAIGIGLWRCVRCPAGYAAAVTLVSLAFFAFNQESSFCNHYYFVIATSCWCVATTSETERGSEGKFEPVVDAGSC